LKKVAGELQETGWPMPLFKIIPGNRFKVARLPLSGSQGSFATDHQTQTLADWSVDTSVAPSAGIQNVLERLESGDAAQAWVDRILQENDLFWTEVMPGINRAAGTPAAREVVAAYETWLSNEFHKSKDQSKGVWSELLRLVKIWTPKN